MNGPADESQEIAAQLHRVHDQGPCVRCGHQACPCCEDWCDLLDCPCADTMECQYR